MYVITPTRIQLLKWPDFSKVQGPRNSIWTRVLDLGSLAWASLVELFLQGADAPVVVFLGIYLALTSCQVARLLGYGTSFMRYEPRKNSWKIPMRGTSVNPVTSRHIRRVLDHEVNSTSRGGGGIASSFYILRLSVCRGFEDRLQSVT